MDSLFTLSLITLGGIGFILGAGLSFASKKFAIEKNETVEKILEILPGANCGGCGYPGCSGYAEAIVLKGAAVNLCAPGGSAVSQKVAKLAGVEDAKTDRRVAFIQCAGSREKAKDKYLYDGVSDCRMAANLGGGPKACDYGCIGFGSCVAVCKFDALTMGADGIPVVDRGKCTGCGACVRVCPKHIIELLPDTTMIYLACSSHEKGKAVKDVCSVGCIGCGICVKVTEGNLVEMKDNLPEIKYDASPNLILAHYKCPSKSFVDLAPKRPHMVIDPKCKGHGKCAEACPVKECISGAQGETHRIDPKKCIGCGLCVGVCPEKAVRVVGAMGYVGMDISR